MMRRILRWPKLAVLVVILFVTSLYIYLFPAPNLAYVGVVLLHAGLGVVAAALLVPRVYAIVRAKSFFIDSGWLLLAAGAILGVVLLFIGTIRSHWTWMYAHVVVSFAAVALLAVRWMATKGWRVTSRTASVATTVLCLGLAAGLAYGGWH